MTDLQRILRETKTIAVVGASANPNRASHEVYTYLRNTGDYTVYPVNPTISEIDGVPTYPSLADLPVVPDLVDVFRRRSELAGGARRCTRAAAAAEDTVAPAGSVRRTGGA